MWMLNFCHLSLGFSAMQDKVTKSAFSAFIPVLQRSVHPGLSFRETSQGARGRTEDGLRGAEKSRVVPRIDSQTGNTARTQI